MSTGRWALLVASVTVVACGKAEPSGAGAPLPMGAAGSAVSAGAGAGAAGAATGGAASGSGGGQAVAGAATGGAGGGAPSSSGAGGSPASAAGTSGGPSGLGPDPAPVGEPAGVVKTSSNYLVFAQQTTAGTGQRQLMFLDLQGNGEPVQVSAAASKNVVHSIAGDRHAYLYAQVDPFGQSPAPVPRDDDLYLNVFTDSGYLPGALVAGFAGRPALYSPLRFDATSRFAVVARYLPPRGLDFIDAARNTRHYSLDFTVDNFSFAWAPTGYLFEYTLMSTLADQNPANRQTYLAKLIDGGISAPQLLPTGIRDQHFTADARRLTYSLENGTDPISFGYVEPPAAPRQFYASTGDRNVSAPPTFFMEAGDESLLAELAVPGDASHWAISRLFSDGIRPPVVVSDPAPSVDAAISESGSLAALFSTTDDETQRIELLRGTERFTLSETKGAEEFEGFFVGEHLVYFILYPDSTTGGELHSAALQGSTVVDTVVGKSDRWLSNFCQTAVTLPGNRYYYLYTQPAGIRFIDLALGEPAATRSIDATEPTATVDECPVCNAAGDACAYVERTDTHSKIFRVHFDPAGPSEPKLIFESDQSISLVAAHIQ